MSLKNTIDFDIRESDPFMYSPKIFFAERERSSYVNRMHVMWYKMQEKVIQYFSKALFGPSVTAGILKPSDLAGYRNGAVYIRNSKHVPPSYEAVRDLMPAFYDLLSNEGNAVVHIVLGHFLLLFD